MTAIQQFAVHIYGDGIKYAMTQYRCVEPRCCPYIVTDRQFPFVGTESGTHPRTGSFLDMPAIDALRIEITATMEVTKKPPFDS